MGGSVHMPRNILRSSLARAAIFFAFWLILCGTKPADLLVGVFAAIAATWASLRLLPPGQPSLRFIALARLVLRFPRQSVAAGIDVARRAFDPRLALRPGFVIYHSQLSPGPRRDAFCTLMSLLPGMLPCGSAAGDGLMIHCLDVDRPVIEELAAEEALLLEVMGGTRGNG
jgi:multicomponent Na+:H+ antiporter subunit E